MKQLVFGFLFISLSLAAESLQEIAASKEVSFYRGYLLWEEFRKRSEIKYDFAEVMLGVLAGEKGLALPLDEKTMREKISAYQKANLERLTVENLAASEVYLKKIAAEENMQEIVPDKLYYKVTAHGTGKSVLAGSSPIMTYAIFIMSDGKEEEWVTIDEPRKVPLKEVIPGFAKGVAGMQENEERILYIHPELAYGTSHRKIDPNALFIIKVAVKQTMQL